MRMPSSFLSDLVQQQNQAAVEWFANRTFADLEREVWIHHWRTTGPARQYQVERRLCRHFVSWRPMPLRAITTQHVKQWYTVLVDTHGPGEARYSLAIWRAMWHVGQRLELIPEMLPVPGSMIKPSRPKRVLVRAYPDEVQKIREALTLEPLDLQAYFLTLLLTACRRQEAEAMRWADLDFTHQVWHKPHTKNGEEQYLPLPEELMALLGALPRVSDKVFVRSRSSFTFHWLRIRTALQLHRLTLHSLRKTAGSMMLENGADLRAVADICNHDQVTTTQRHYIVSNRPERLRPILVAHAKQVLGQRGPRTQGRDGGGRFKPLATWEPPEDAVTVPPSPSPPPAAHAPCTCGAARGTGQGPTLTTLSPQEGHHDEATPSHPDRGTEPAADELHEHAAGD